MCCSRVAHVLIMCCYYVANMLLMCCQCVVLPVLLPHAIVLDGLPLIVHCGVRPHVVLIHLVSVLVLLLSALPRHRRGNTQPYIYIYIYVYLVG